MRKSKREGARLEGAADGLESVMSRSVAHLIATVDSITVARWRDEGLLRVDPNFLGSEPPGYIRKSLAGIVARVSPESQVELSKLLAQWPAAEFEIIAPFALDGIVVELGAALDPPHLAFELDRMLFWPPLLLDGLACVAVVVPNGSHTVDCSVVLKRDARGDWIVVDTDYLYTH